MSEINKDVLNDVYEKTKKKQGNSGRDQWKDRGGRGGQGRGGQGRGGQGRGGQGRGGQGRGGQGRGGQGRDGQGRGGQGHGTSPPTKDYLMKRQYVNPIPGDPLQIWSWAAHGTTVKHGQIVVDTAHLTHEMGTDVQLVLITHGHEDHSDGVEKAFRMSDGKILTIICPASAAEDIFMTIRSKFRTYKGVKFSSAQIMKHLRIFAVIKPGSDEYAIGTAIVCPISGIPIATTVTVGQIIEIDLAGRSKCAIKPFHCHHTVDTVGYGIYGSTQRTNRVIEMKAGLTIEITPPKMTGEEKKDYQAAKNAVKARIKAVDKLNDESKVDAMVDHNLHRIDFASVHNFIDAMNIDPSTIQMAIVSRPMGDKGYILDSIRQITFKQDVVLNACDEGGKEHPFPKEAFIFFKEYATDMHGAQKIDTHHPVLTPQMMVFGDTAATVFSQQLVRDMIKEFPRIVIESTFLDGESTLSQIGAHSAQNDPDDSSDCDDCTGCSTIGREKSYGNANSMEKNVKRNQYLRFKDKKHIFLEDLVHLFKKYPGKEFVLMHFSVRYTVERVRDTISHLPFSNVFAAV
jgi:ribonuclease BN (tRNA processing enzyme)